MCVFLKSTGVVRRIDELGRIVIPKEIRRTLRIRDGENLEILLENEAIVLKKISKMANFKEFAVSICDQLYAALKLSVAITDREKVICVSGGELKKIEDNSLNNELMELIDNRETLADDLLLSIKFGSNVLLSGYFVIHPLVTSIDSLGLVLIYSENPMDKSIKNITKFIANLVASGIDVG